MSNLAPSPPANALAKGTVSYDDVGVVITPEGPNHYEVLVNRPDGDRTEHAVEFVAINATIVHLDGPIWFTETDLHVGIPSRDSGETAWVWP